MKKRIVFVGGFLGSGKTAFLLTAARALALRGLKAGLVTNDRVSKQVDAAVLKQSGFAVREVKGSCLRCRFNGLAAAIGAMEEDLVLAEPMGTCADLSATILSPLKRYPGMTVTLAPLSVLVEPERAEALLAGSSGTLHSGAAYILRAQLEEADFILLSKCDGEVAGSSARLCEELRREFPHARVFAVSAHRHEGVDVWLDAVLGEEEGTFHPTSVDYLRYARGEHALAWLNARATARGARDWNGFAWRVMRLLRAELAMRGLPVGHVKLLLRADGAVLSADFTGTAAQPSFQGMVSLATTAELTLNGRVEGEPAVLETIVRDVLAAACREEVVLDISELRSARPAPPDPSYRFDAGE